MGMFSEGTTMYGAAIDMHASNSSYVELLKIVGKWQACTKGWPGRRSRYEAANTAGLHGDVHRERQEHV